MDGYPNIPRHIEEAIIIYINLKGKNINLQGRTINPDTVERFKMFYDFISRNRNNIKENFNIIKKNFGDSYFFYSAFYSGIK